MKHWLKKFVAFPQLLLVGPLPHKQDAERRCRPLDDALGSSQGAALLDPIPSNATTSTSHSFHMTCEVPCSARSSAPCRAG
jgi:hypothetical protein